MVAFLAEWLAREVFNKKRAEVVAAVSKISGDNSEDGLKDANNASVKAASSLSTASTTMIIGLSRRRAGGHPAGGVHHPQHHRAGQPRSSPG